MMVSVQQAFQYMIDHDIIQETPWKLDNYVMLDSFLQAVEIKAATVDKESKMKRTVTGVYGQAILEVLVDIGCEDKEMLQMVGQCCISRIGTLGQVQERQIER